MNTSPFLDRRDFLHRAGLGLCGLPFASALSAAAPNGGRPLSMDALHRFPHMMEEWLVARVREAEAVSDAARAQLHTKEDALQYVKSCQKRIRSCFGPEPEKTPLKARVTGTVDRDVYKIEKVVFESRPDYLVTGNLYVPKGRKFPLPGVVGVCGHSLNGKAAGPYQSFAQGLARMGYVVFIIDPVGQGERLQYLTPDLKSRFKGGVGDHIQMGNQQTLVGEFLGAWFAWDGVRALDYLLTREEVDPKHVGITGNSGGGTQTTWLCGIEQRWTMAGPACFVTTFRHNAENELPADTEQCPPNALGKGLDHSDFIAALAPKPVILLTKERDFFDVRGGEEAFARLKQLYTLLGAPDNIRLQTGPTDHGYSQENREAMYRFFNEQTKVSDAQTEPALTIEKDETLWCTPRGTVSELNSRTVFSFTKELSQSLGKSRPKLEGAALKEAVREVLKLESEAVGDKAPYFRILRPQGNRNYPAKNYGLYAVETEPGILALVTRLSEEPLVSRPPRGQKRAVLLVSHHSADRDLREEDLVRELLKAEPDSAFFACDVRGIGDSQPDICGPNDFLKPYGSDYFLAAHCLMLGRPYLGFRVLDVLRVMQWLGAYGHEEIHLVGNGWGALVATFAALLDNKVKQVTLKNALTSFSEVAETEDYHWPFAALPYGVLKKFDLPDCYRALEAKKIRSIAPWDATNGMD